MNKKIILLLISSCLIIILILAILLHSFNSSNIEANNLPSLEVENNQTTKYSLSDLGLNIGSKINYVPISNTYTPDTNNLGTKNSKLSTENLTWQVMSQDETTGYITLVGTPISDYIELNGISAYLYGEKELNTICAKLYSTTIDGIDYTARSINENDILTLCAYTPSGYNYGEKISEIISEDEALYYPYDDNGNAVWKSGTPKDTLCSFYGFYDEDLSSLKYEKIKLVFGSNTNHYKYWLASTEAYANADSNYMTFGMKNVFVKIVRSELLCTSNKEESSYTSSLRPVISLPSNIIKSLMAEEPSQNNSHINVGQKLTVNNIVENLPYYIGATVSGYTWPNSQTENIVWKLFYADYDENTREGNVYLIASDYVANVPSTKNNLMINKNSDYCLSMDNVISDYSGYQNINSDLWKKWLNSAYTLNCTSNDDSMKATAYMLDTNTWNKLYAGNNAEYAIGGPTIEMFFKSYNTKNNTNYICDMQSSVLGSSGNFKAYTVNKSQMVSIDIDNDLYVLMDSPDDNGKAYGMWIASPSGSNAVFRITNNGQVLSGSYYNKFCGFRPIVCLSSDVLFESTTNGTTPELKIVQ